MKKTIYIFIIFFGVTHFLYSQVWHSLDNGVNSPVYTFKINNNELFVGGEFDFVGGLDSVSFPNGFKATQIAKWNGANWDTVRNVDGYNLVNGIKSIEFSDNEIYVGGDFSDFSVSPTRNFLAKIDSNFHWCNVGNIGFPNSDVSTFKIKDKLYFACGFNYIGSTPNYNHIAGWDNISFSKLSIGLQGQRAYVLSEYNEQLIAGGGFTYAGDTIAFGVAVWDGLKWFPLDTGLLGTVYTFLVDTINNFLYAGGTIDYAGGNGDMTRIYNIACWNGYKWSPVGSDSGSIFFNGIFALKMYQNYLFAGGGSSSGTISDTLLVKWDGTSWHKIDGPNETLNCLEVYNDELYVGGFFDYIADSLYNHVASYYEPPDTVSCTFIQPFVNAMLYNTKEPKDTLYTTPPYHIQFYTNNKYASSWVWDFGDGNTANIREPAHTYTGPGTYNVTLEVIHPHNLSSQVCTLNVSKTITIIDNTAIKETPTQKIEYLGQNIPNPFTNTTAIPYNVPVGSKGFLQITDTKGELIDEYALQQGKNKLEISMGSYTAGVYLYSLVLDGVVVETKRMVMGE